jgi:hypothetical protein
MSLNMVEYMGAEAAATRLKSRTRGSSREVYLDMKITESIGTKQPVMIFRRPYGYLPACGSLGKICSVGTKNWYLVKVLAFSYI